MFLKFNNYLKKNFTNLQIALIGFSVGMGCILIVQSIKALLK